MKEGQFENFISSIYSLYQEKSYKHVYFYKAIKILGIVAVRKYERVATESEINQ